MGRAPVGAAALVVGIGLAVVGLGLYQAWWTVAFPIGGAVAYWLDRSGARPGRTIGIGGAVAGALAMGGMGVFLVVMSPSGCARPDIPCPDIPPFLVLGVALLVSSIIVLGVVSAAARRTKSRS